MKIWAPIGDKRNYTWQQSLRFFCIGALWAMLTATLPVVWAAYHNWKNYADPIDWDLLRDIAVASAVPALVSYGKAHRNLLKIPPFLELPPEFAPNTTEESNGERG